MTEELNQPSTLEKFSNAKSELEALETTVSSMLCVLSSCPRLLADDDYMVGTKEYTKGNERDKEVGFTSISNAYRELLKKVDTLKTELTEDEIKTLDAPAESVMSDDFIEEQREAVIQAKKAMPKLTEHFRTILSHGADNANSWDAFDVVGPVEESMYMEEATVAWPFVEWVCVNKQYFGSGNIDEVYAQWLAHVEG